MRCNAFQQRLDDLLDQRESPSADQHLAHHAARCSQCREVLAATETLLAILQPGSVDNVSPPTLAPWNLVRAAMWLGTTAATLLIGFFAAWSQWTPHSDQPGTSANTTPVVLTAAMEKTPSLVGSESTDQGSFVYQPLISLSLLSRANWSGIDAQVPFASHVPSIETEWLRVVADGMTPFQESMSNTLEVIRKTLSTGGKTVAVNG